MKRSILASLVSAALIPAYSSANDLINTAPLTPDSSNLIAGLYDAEHTALDGTQNTTVRYRERVSYCSYGSCGYGDPLLGDSTRYKTGTNEINGNSTWAVLDDQTVRIGLYSDGYRGVDDYMTSTFTHSAARSFDENGISRYYEPKIAGQSYRYAVDGTRLGTHTWFFDGTNTVLTGLTDAAHTRDDGWQESMNNYASPQGQVLGQSTRYSWADGTVPNQYYYRYSAWLYDGQQTVTLGMSGANFTGESYAGLLNSNGQVTGTSRRVDGGNTTWLYDGQQSVQIGLYDAEHTRNGSYQQNTVDRLSEDGNVIGSSVRYDANGSENGQSTWAADANNTYRTGLQGDEFTLSSDGYSYSSNVLFAPSSRTTNYVSSSGCPYRGPCWNNPIRIAEHGHVAGTSNRYSGDQGAGNGLWIYNADDHQTRRVGLYDAEHTYGATDFQSSNFVTQMNELGQVAGHSRSYTSASTSEYSYGESAWWFDGLTTHRIGLLDSEHFGANNEHNSNIDYNQVAGQLVGTSRRYLPDGSNGGNSTWLYDGLTTVQTGLTGAGFTRADGIRDSRNNTSLRFATPGVVAGESSYFGVNGQYNGNARVLWLYNGSETLQVSLTTEEHISDQGYANYGIDDRNNNGMGLAFAGYNNRYAGANGMGLTSWFFDGQQTHITGLRDVEHTRADGYRYSYGTSNRIPELWSNGITYGQSERYNGEARTGYSAWLYNNGETHKVGLEGDEHTADDGTQNSHIIKVNQKGQAIGTTSRYLGTSSEYYGNSAWFFDGENTIELGLQGEDFQRNDGYEQSSASAISENGRVAGTTHRYIEGLDNAGYSAWLYDDVTATITDLTLSERDDGYALSSVNYLDDEWLFGNYELFDGADSLGRFAFFYTEEQGLRDLEQYLFSNGLDIGEFGWDSISYISSFDETSGMFSGYGYNFNGIGGEFLLSASAVSAVPVPAAIWLFGSGLLGLIGVARRKKAA